jgi:hypothetical protein
VNEKHNCKLRPLYICLWQLRGAWQVCASRPGAGFCGGVWCIPLQSASMIHYMLTTRVSAVCTDQSVGSLRALGSVGVNELCRCQQILSVQFPHVVRALHTP